MGPDKLRFDFTHGERLSLDEVRAVEDRVNEWVVDNRPVHAIETTRAEAEALGAMALFGEKYGDWVRMVEVEDVSRELCGGTHVRSSAEVGLFQIVAETSSASNVRRIEALTGPAAVVRSRERTAELRRIADLLRVPDHDAVRAVEKLAKRVKELSSSAPKGGRAERDALVASATEVSGIRVVTELVEGTEPHALLELSDQVKQALGDAAVVLGSAVEGRAHLVANFAPAAVERGLKAGAVARAAAEVAGGGGGGRDAMAQAGGRDPEKLPEAIATARREIERALA